jgi:hypothetical protein
VDDPPTQRAWRRGPRARVRRRRLLLGAGVAALCVLALVLFAFPTTRHVKIVRVVRTGQVAPAKTSTYPLPEASAGVQPGRTYQAAPDAPSPSPTAVPGSAAADATSASHPVLPADVAASFKQLSATLPGDIELAVAPLGEGSTKVLGADVPAHGWSTTKVPVLVALLKARGARGLTAQENLLAHSAITESNNESILALFADLEQIEGGLDGASAYIQQLFRQSGDDETVVTTASPPPGAVTTFGQTEWRPSEAVKFFRALGNGCLLPADQSGYVLNLMENIEPSESWGLGSAGFGSVAFKGGWGPEPSGAYLVRQSGIIDVGSSRGVAVSIVAFPSSGSFSTGTQMLTDTAMWLHHELRLVPRGAVGCAGE